MERKERESNPQGLEAHPFSRRDTAPVAVLPNGSGRSRTCPYPIKSRRLTTERRSREMWPAGIEPAARRVSTGRSTGLSYGHARWARLDSNQRRLVCWTSTLARLSYSPACVLEELRDKGSNLVFHVQSVASCPLDDPGTWWAPKRP